MPRFDTPLNTNDQSLDRVLNAGLPVALLLWDGDPLDTALDNALRTVAKQDAGDILIAKLNTRENPAAAARVSGPLPALITYRAGDEATRATALSATAFRAHVDYLLERGPAPAQPSPAANGARATANGANAANAHPIEVSDATFARDVLNSDLPVLVDLWAPWCGPCRMIAPIVEKIAQDYAGRLKVTKLNVDHNPQTAQTYQVQGIPTLLLFKQGRVVDRIVGAAPEILLRGKVDTVLRA